MRRGLSHLNDFQIQMSHNLLKCLKLGTRHLHLAELGCFLRSNSVKLALGMVAEELTGCVVMLA